MQREREREREREITERTGAPLRPSSRKVLGHPQILQRDSRMCDTPWLELSIHFGSAQRQLKLKLRKWKSKIRRRRIKSEKEKEFCVHVHVCMWEGEGERERESTIERLSAVSFVKLKGVKFFGVSHRLSSLLNERGNVRHEHRKVCIEEKSKWKFTS